MRAGKLTAASTLALLVGAGCGGSAPGPEPYVRLKLTPADADPWNATPTVVSRVEPAADPKSWRFESGDLEPNAVLERMVADGQVVRLGGQGSRTRSVIRLRRSIDPSEFNQIQIHHVVDGSTKVRVTLLGEGLEDWSSIFVPLEGETEARRTVIQVPRSVRASGLRNELRVIYAGGLRDIGLLAVELVDQPAEGLLPLPHDGSAPIRIGEEWRDGFGVTPEYALEANFGLVRGARLLFSAGELLETYEPGREVTLDVTVRGGGGEVARSFAIGGEGLDPGWRVHALDLGDLKPGPVTAKFTVDAGGDPYAACAIAVPALRHGPPARPSVLLVTSDTHRGDYLGVAGDSDFISTPVLDRLAANGVYFDQCFALSNVTNPSHGCLLTGLDPSRTRITSNNQTLSESARTLAEVFRSRGYRTWAALSVRHLVGDVSGLGQGFDRLSGPIEGDRAAPETLDLALRWLDEEQHAPLFLWVHFYDPHWPYAPLAEFEELYRHEIDTEREPFEWDFKLEKTRGDIENLDVPRARYKAEVTFLDDQLQRILEHEFFRDGIVSLVGDHGESLGEHGIYFTHAELYPEVLHVPLLLRWPEAPKGTRISGVTSQNDLGRTLLNLAGMQSEAFPGRSLLRHIEAGRAGDTPHFALAGSGVCASVTRRGMHLILHLKRHRSSYSVIRKEVHATELYDLRADPSCEHDLVDERPEVAAELRALLIRWLRNADPVGLLGGGVNDPDLERQLAELGYVDLGDAEAEPLWIPDDCEWCVRYGT